MTSRLYDRNFVLACIGQCLFVLANTIVLTNFARWVTFLGGDERDIGWITGAGSVVGLMLRPWLGQWVDRLGTRFTWGIGLALFLPASLLYLVCRSLGPLIYVLRAGTYVGAALVFSSSLTYVTQTTPTDRRTEAIGILGAGGFLGILLGPNISDLFLGAHDRTLSQFLGLFGVAAIAIVVGLGLLAMLRSPPSHEAHAAGPIGLRDFLTVARRHWPGRIVAVSVVFGLCMAVPFGYLSKFVDRVGIADLGPFFAAYAGWGLLVRLGSRRFPERYGTRTVMLAGLLLMGVGMFLYLPVKSAQPYALLLPALVCGTGHALMFHTMIALAIEPFPPTARGTGAVLALMIQDIGLVGGAPVLGLIAHTFGYPWLFISVGIACIAAAAFYATEPGPLPDEAHDGTREQAVHGSATIGLSTAVPPGPPPLLDDDLSDSNARQTVSSRP